MRLHFIFIMSTEERHVLMLEMSTQTNVKWPEWLLKEIFVHQGWNSRHRQAISYHKYNSRMNKTWLWSAFSMVTAQGLVLSSLYHTMDHTIYVLFRGRGLRDLKILMANQYNKCHKIQDVCQTQHVSFFLM